MLQTEKLVDLEQTYQGVFCFEPRYFMEGRPGALRQSYVRESVAAKLKAASDNLPHGFKFKIWDTWRSYATQKSLYDEFYKKLLKQGLSAEQAFVEMRSFVSYPSNDPYKPFVHNTGGAVDLTIVDESGIELDMGTGFDDFTPRAYTMAFEKEVEMRNVHSNRMLLLNVMMNVGFTNLPSEWWHFDYGDSFWAERTDNKILYYGIDILS